MTVPRAAQAPAPVPGPPQLVLVALGPVADLVVLQQRAAPRLARLAGLPLRPIVDVDDPDRALAALAAGEGPSPPPAAHGWLAPLPLDPGLPLARGGNWALALAAWRQPTVLLVDGTQPASGLAAAATALLREARVPLLGLIQWSGCWEGSERHLDGLPWLGWLPAEPDPAGSGDDGADDDAASPAALAVLPSLRLAWQRLELD